MTNRNYYTYTVDAVIQVHYCSVAILSLHVHVIYRIYHTYEEDVHCIYPPLLWLRSRGYLTTKDIIIGVYPLSDLYHVTTAL